MQKNFNTTLIILSLALTTCVVAKETDCLVKVSKNFHQLIAVRGNIDRTECFSPDGDCDLIRISPDFRGEISANLDGGCSSPDTFDQLPLSSCDQWMMPDKSLFIFRPKLTLRTPNSDSKLTPSDCVFRGAWAKGRWFIKDADNKIFGKGNTKGTSGSNSHRIKNEAAEIPGECEECCDVEIVEDEITGGISARVHLEGVLSGRSRIDFDSEKLNCKSVFSFQGNIHIPLDSNGFPLKPTEETPWRMAGNFQGENFCPECHDDNVCGGIAGLPCADGEVCDLPPGECDSADLFGECVPKPEACPEIFAPVCGCDGNTYSNDCDRLHAGVGKAHDGECKQPGI